MEFKTRLFLRIVCLLIVISLCFAVYINGKELSCDKCVINFKQTRQLGHSVNIVHPIKLLDLSNNLSKGICLIEWDNKNGYSSKINKINLTQDG